MYLIGTCHGTVISLRQVFCSRIERIINIREILVCDIREEPYRLGFGTVGGDECNADVEVLLLEVTMYSPLYGAVLVVYGDLIRCIFRGGFQGHAAFEDEHISLAEHIRPEVGGHGICDSVAVITITVWREHRFLIRITVDGYCDG